MKSSVMRFVLEFHRHEVSGAGEDFLFCAGNFCHQLRDDLVDGGDEFTTFING
jgi:hypothetical protein